MLYHEAAIWALKCIHSILPKAAEFILQILNLGWFLQSPEAIKEGLTLQNIPEKAPERLCSQGIYEDV